LITIRWTNEAVVHLAKLREKERAALFAHLGLVVEFPRMYPVRQGGRFVGLRYFQVDKRWLVYYKVSEDDVLVFDIVPARAQAE